MRHMMAVTAKEIENGIVSGTVRALIIQGERVHIGDDVVLHGFEGEAFRTAWSWRQEVTVTRIQAIWVGDSGIAFTPSIVINRWNGKMVNNLAKSVGIMPATGVHLKEILETIHGKFPKGRGEKYQIIRW